MILHPVVARLRQRIRVKSLDIWEQLILDPLLLHLESRQYMNLVRMSPMVDGWDPQAHLHLLAGLRTPRDSYPFTFFI